MTIPLSSVDSASFIMNKQDYFLPDNAYVVSFVNQNANSA